MHFHTRTQNLPLTLAHATRTRTHTHTHMHAHAHMNMDMSTHIHMYCISTSLLKHILLLTCFLSSPPFFICSQITFAQYELYQSIRPREMLIYITAKDNGASAPNLTKFLRFGPQVIL